MNMKTSRDKDFKRALSFKREIQAAAAKEEKNSLANSFEPLVNSHGKIKQLRYAGPDNLNPALKKIITGLLSTDT